MALKQIAAKPPGYRVFQGLRGVDSAAPAPVLSPRMAAAIRRGSPGGSKAA